MIDPGLETKNSTPLTNGGRSDSGQGIDIDIDTVSSSDSNDNAGLMAQLEAMQSKGSKRCTFTRGHGKLRLSRY